MAKVTEYPRITKIKDNDILLVDGPDGTRTILKNNAAKELGGDIIAVTKSGTKDKVTLNLTDNPVNLATEKDVAEVSDALLSIGTAAGSIVSIDNAKAGANFKEIKVAIEPVQAGSGDPSPDNVRSISGWTAARVTRCRKNMLDPGVIYTGIGYNPSVGTKLNIAEAADHLTDNGDGTFSLAMGSWGHRAFVFSLIPGVSLRFSATFLGANVATTYGYLSEDDVVLSSVAQRGDSVVKNITFTGTADRRKAFVYFGPGNTAQTVTVDRPQLEMGSVSTDYEPYSSDTFDIAFPSEAGTVYGGTLDLTAGTLTVDRVIVALRSNGLNWHASGSYPGGFYADHMAFANTYGIPTLKAQTPFMCSHAKSVTGTAAYVYGTCFMDYSVNIRIMAEGSTAQDWKDYIQAQYDAGTPIQACLTLRNPVVYQLTPVQIAAIAGVNTVWADCGAIDITYLTDIKVQDMIAEESGSIASRAFTAGEYTIVKGELYKVTADVSPGTELVPGTNIEDTTVGDELNDLNYLYENAVQEIFNSKNLIGLKGGVLYPAHLSAGTTLTMSTADKQKIDTTNFNLIFYDADRNPTGQTFNFSQAVSYRTVTLSDECYYIAWNKDAPREVQVEIGDTRTDYVPYLLNIRNEETIKDLLSDGELQYGMNFKALHINPSASAHITVDTTAKTITIPNDTSIFVGKKGVTGTERNRYVTTIENTVSYGSTGSTLNLLLFNTTDGSFRALAYRGEVAATELVIATFRTSPFMMSIACPYIVDGAAYGLSGVTASQVFNGEPFTGIYDYNTPLTAYCALFNEKSVVESFAFFTDPHILGFDDDDRNDVRKENYLKRVQRTYNNSPCSFLVCGGDWLNNDTTPAEACYRLGNLKGIADHLLGGCKLVIGNHDVNEQGITEEGAARGTGVLANSTIASLMFRDTDTKKSYYSFDGANSKCYVLDTGRAGSYHSAMLDYDWEQIDWLAGKLAEDDPDHGIIFLHTIYNGTADSPELQINAVNFGTLVEAYNSRTSVELNSKTYNFTACTGRIEFWVAGHTHRDEIGTLGGIPYISTATNSYTSDVPLIDLMLADYVGRKLYTVRVGGTGENRTIDLNV